MTTPQTHWSDDRDEVVSFVRWFWAGTFNYIGTTGEVIDCFEKPWHWDEEYAAYKEDKKDKARN
jgi:hypothetical protein